MRLTCLIGVGLFLALGTAAEARTHHHGGYHHAHVARHHVVRNHMRHRLAVPERGVRTVTLPHPHGCPGTEFCGCGVAVRVFGRPVRDLWLASNWLKFPAARPAPGMVAARSGHVFYIEKMLSSIMALAYDPNSGGHMTRVHPRSIQGFSVRNPHAGSHRT